MTKPEATARLSNIRSYNAAFRGTKHETPEWTICDWIRSWGFQPADLGMTDVARPINPAWRGENAVAPVA